MEDLIKAPQIFAKYGNPKHPTHCSHDKLTVCVDPEVVSAEDKAELKRLSFSEDGETFYSFRFGAA